MTKKHFEAAAEYIRGIHQAAAAAQASEPAHADNLRARAAGAEDVCLQIFGQFNDRFDSCRFIEACRPE